MAERIEPFIVTIPAATPVATPITLPLPFMDGEVVHVDITVPPGPSGLVGFQILHMGQSIIPRAGTTFIVTDNRVLSWDLHNFPTASGWEVLAYNVDVYDHSLHIEIHINEVTASTPAAMRIVPIG